MPYILKSGRILGKPRQPVALETIFSWLLQEKANLCSSLNAGSSFHVSKSITGPYFREFFLHPKRLSLEETTKLRVVLDASTKIYNHTFLTGQNLQNDISAIQLLFRLNLIVFICDINAVADRSKQ